ncbi:PhzF family phenazine biosynthesis protein [Oryzifoliimicrobium ureilyticus]|uniref:PhzF family phenazine biosynthesis protein n=1 Tax=Oryzifoliimicrobium ureilyticus TaxID=3113724 RepID=UPI0030762650
MARSYSIYDVFTEEKLKGNPLAVVFDAEGLSTETMQAIAREFNLSETVFLLASEAPACKAQLRIFTPSAELPFAGHPTVGTAIALAEREHGDVELDVVCMLEEKIGPVRCAVRLRPGEVSFSEFDLPRKPQSITLPLDLHGIANSLSLKSSDLGFENHVPSLWTAGVPFIMIPVRDLGAAAQIEFDPQSWEHTAPFVDGRLASAYVYCRSGIHHAADFHTRMFTSDMGLIEDPATGSAAAAFSGAVVHFDKPVDGHYPILIEQGVEMGRASYIHLHIDLEGGLINNARIGGHALKVADGVLDL